MATGDMAPPPPLEVGGAGFLDVFMLGLLGSAGLGLSGKLGLPGRLGGGGPPIPPRPPTLPP